MEALLAMTDTLEELELYKESQEAMREFQVIGKRAQFENNPSPLYLYQQIAASIKESMDARRELDTLHVGSKIRLHGLINQKMNGKKGNELGPAINNRIGIQLQGEERQVSIRICNIRYKNPPKWQKNDLVSGGHGQAGSWRGQ